MRRWLNLITWSSRLGCDISSSSVTISCCKNSKDCRNAVSNLLTSLTEFGDNANSRSFRLLSSQLSFLRSCSEGFSQRLANIRVRSSSVRLSLNSLTVLVDRCGSLDAIEIRSPSNECVEFSPTEDGSLPKGEFSLVPSRN
jgi:hypothetical protein